MSTRRSAQSRRVYNFASKYGQTPNHFAQAISVDPGSLGLTPLIAANYSAKAAAFAAGYKTAYEPDTRTRGTVATKDNLKDDLIAYTRLVVRTVQACMSLSDGQRADLGITIRSMPARIGRPRSSPSLRVLAANGRILRLHAKDTTSSRRGIPAGVAGVSVFYFAGDEAPASLDEWTLAGSSTRARIGVTLPVLIELGTKVWLAARWFNPRSQGGPTSMPLCIVLGGISLIATAA